MPTALCTATNLKTLTQNPPFVAQSHLCSKPAGVGHVSSPGSDFQVPRCEGIPVLGLGMALSSPCHRPLVGKDRTKPCLPPCAGLRELSCRPQGGAGGGKETPRKSGGMRRAAHPAGMEAKHLPQPGQPCPREGPRADRHPNPPFGVPKMGQKRSAAGPALSPLIPLGFLPSSQGKTTATSTSLVTTLTLLPGHLRVGDTGVP